MGLIGAGGSILALPILVYLFGIDASETAPAYSLFIVGVSSLIGAIIKYKEGHVDMKTAVIFGFPALVSVYLTRRFLIPEIPEEIFTIGTFVLTKGAFIMTLFAFLMIIASFSMIKEQKERTKKNSTIKYNYPLIVLEGSMVGVLTGMVGAGGGFIIIPALVVMSNLSMKKAIGTSLLIIATKSLFGFVGDLSVIEIDWPLLLLFTALAVLGIFVGDRMSIKIKSEKLKKGFGWFVLIMGGYIFIKELFFN